MKNVWNYRCNWNIWPLRLVCIKYKSVDCVGYATVEAISFCTRSTIIQSLHCKCSYDCSLTDSLVTFLHLTLYTVKTFYFFTPYSTVVSAPNHLLYLCILTEHTYVLLYQACCVLYWCRPVVSYTGAGLLSYTGSGVLCIMLVQDCCVIHWCRLPIIYWCRPAVS